jgi:hypothetical protein
MDVMLLTPAEADAVVVNCVPVGGLETPLLPRK